jgi:hypothetical protein
MLYKVTPMMPPPSKEPKSPREPGHSRRRRKTAVYDSEGNEVLITLSCLKCRQIKPLAQFGLRKMADGAVRNQPWCRSCRSVAGGVKDTGEHAGIVSPVYESARGGEGRTVDLSDQTDSPLKASS